MKENLKDFIKRTKIGDVRVLKARGYTDEDIDKRQQEAHEEWKQKNGYTPLKRGGKKWQNDL